MKKIQCLYAERSCYRPLLTRNKPRAGKYERLLKALLKCFTVESKLLLISGHLSMLTPKNEQQLIAIKERMEKGVKV